MLVTCCVWVRAGPWQVLGWLLLPVPGRQRAGVRGAPPFGMIAVPALVLAVAGWRGCAAMVNAPGDPASGKDLMGACWYAPGSGDFISADTVQVSRDPDPVAGEPFAYADGAERVRKGGGCCEDGSQDRRRCGEVGGQEGDDRRQTVVKKAVSVAKSEDGAVGREGSRGRGPRCGGKHRAQS